jgi:hypothetical protein
LFPFAIKWQKYLQPFRYPFEVMANNNLDMTNTGFFLNFIFPCTLQLLIHYYKLTIWARDLLETFAGFCF